MQARDCVTSAAWVLLWYGLLLYEVSISCKDPNHQEICETSYEIRILYPSCRTFKLIAGLPS